MPEEEGEAEWDELYVNYFTAPSEQPWRPQGDNSPRRVWSDGTKSPNQDGAHQDQSALVEKGRVRPVGKKSLVACLV